MRFVTLIGDVHNQATHAAVTCCPSKKMKGYAERDEHHRELRIHDALQTASVCKRQRSKEFKWGHRQANALLDVLIMIPERADGPSKSKDTAEIESNSYQSASTGVRACTDKGCWQAGKTETYT